MMENKHSYFCPDTDTYTLFWNTGRKFQLAQSSVLHLKSGPVPRSVPVCGSLHVTKLDLICGIGTVHPHWEFHLEELVRFSPLHLKITAAEQVIFQISPQISVWMCLRYPCAELEVRTRGFHDYLLRHSALITDLEGKADNATELLWRHNMCRLHHLQHRLSKGWSFARFI